MRLLLLLVLALANLGVRWSSRELRRERAELLAELAERTDALAAGRESARAEASLRTTAGRLEESLSRLDLRPIDLSSLRESLLQAESGLDLDRLSLDFRPLSTAASNGNGSRITLSSRGSFHAVAAYLGRLEISGLPLAAEELRLRRDPDGRVTLDVRWSALWDVEGELSLAEAARVDAWLENPRDATLERDLFVEQRGGTAAQPSATAFTEPPHAEPPYEVPPPEPAASSSAMPALTGFVLARPELEPDVDRRVLAALRFEGAIHLRTVGEDLGEYEVAAMEALQSVTLVRASTGERVVLYLP